MRIVIRPSGAHPDILTIRDATEQVRDVFELAENDNGSVAWKLVFATTNTPLTITAELVAMDPNLSPGALAAFAKEATSQLHEGFAALAQNRIIDAWAAGPKAVTLKRLLTRNLNGVGRTDIQINERPTPEVVTPTMADSALRELTRIQRQDDLGENIDRSRTEVGSMEGDYLELGHHYAHPAIKLRERKTGREIWCWVSDSDLEQFSEHIRAADIWRHKRVRARGKILFNSAGDVLHIEANDVQLIAAQKITVDEVRDRGFSGGLSVSEYLERLREGDLG